MIPRTGLDRSGPNFHFLEMIAIDWYGDVVPAVQTIGDYHRGAHGKGCKTMFMCSHNMVDGIGPLAVIQGVCIGQKRPLPIIFELLNAQKPQYGGTPEQLALAKAQEEAEDKASLAAIQQAQSERQQALGEAQALGGMFGAQAGLSSQLQSQAQQHP